MWQQRNWKKPLSLTRPAISLNRLEAHNLRTPYLCFVPSPTGSSSCVLAFKCISASSSFETCLLGLGREIVISQRLNIFMFVKESNKMVRTHISHKLWQNSPALDVHTARSCECAIVPQSCNFTDSCELVLLFWDFLSENSFRFDFFPSCCQFGMHVTCFSTSSPLAIFELKTSSQIFIFGSWVFVGPLRQFLWV